MKKFQKFFVIFIFALAILGIGGVSAGDVNMSELTVNDESMVGSVDSDAMQKTYEDDSFKDLNDLIEKTGEKEEVNLTKDYVSNEKVDSKFYGVSIKKSILINGHGHTIDGKGHSLWDIERKNVVIKNINFKDTHLLISSKKCSIINCTFINCKYGAIYSYGKNTLITNSRFINCSSCTAKLCGDDCNIKDCIFINCTGGALEGYNCNVEGCEFINCTYSGMCYGVYFVNNFTLVNSSFINGFWYSEKSGEVCNVTIDGVQYDNSLFENIKANQVINMSNDYIITFPIRIGENNVTVDGGGNIFNAYQAFVITGKNIRIKNFKFSDCSSYEFGGAIMCEGVDTIIENCTFTKCVIDDYAYTYGGAIYDWGLNTRVINCIFEKCSAAYDGAIRGGENITIINSKFINCSDKFYFVAVGFYGNFTLVNSSFINGSWMGSKKGEIYNVTIDGVLYINEFENLSENQIINLSQDYVVTTTNAIAITKNNITVNGNGHVLTGDKVFKITARDITIKNCIFEKCNAIELRGVNCNIVNCTFRDCAGISSYKENCSIINCSFIKCHSMRRSIDDFSLILDGAVYSKGKNCLINNCQFINCSNFDNDGGAILSDGENCIINNSVFINCEVYTSDAGEYCFPSGGAICSSGKNSVISNCNFTKCIAGFGGAINGANFKLINCNFKKCWASYEGDTIWVRYPQVNAKSLKANYGEEIHYTIKVHCDNHLLQKFPVRVEFDGTVYFTGVTDKNGCVELDIMNLPGTHKIRITAEGTTITKKIIIKNVLSLKKVQVKKSAKKLTLTASLKKINGKYLKGKKITFKFNGKKYIAKTNKKGIAKVTIKKSVLKKLKVGKKVKYEAKYIKSTVKCTVKVKK